MITKVIMPQMSLTMQFGTVTDWLKRQGDYVKEGETICTIEGDKAILDVEAPVSGILKKIVAKAGEEFPVKEIMAYIGDPGDVVEEKPEPEAAPKAKVEQASPSAPSNSASASREGRVNASPVAKRLAEERGVDLSKVQGTGPNGRISKEDLQAFLDAGSVSSAQGGGSKVLTGIKKIVAERMAQSNREIPHFHLTITCDVTETNQLRNKYNEKNGAETHISVTDIVVWVVSRQLRTHPALNSSFIDNQIVEHRAVNIGLAVDTPNGLLVVVVKDASGKPLKELAKTRKELTQRALDGKQTPEDVSDATFSITNLGMFGIDTFDPLISPGQVAILSLGQLNNAFELDENKAIKLVEQISMTLGCDHRAVDGVAGAKFLADVKQSLSDPNSMFD